MASFQSYVALGNITRDPELKVTASGTKIAKFGIAVNERRKDQSSGEWIDDPCFIDCTAFSSNNSNLADFIMKWMKKGTLAIVRGKFKLDQWTDKDGQKRQKLNLTVHECTFGGSSNQDGNQSGGQQRQQQPQQGQYNQQHQSPASQPPPYSSNPNDYGQGGYQHPTGDDDIPF